MFICKSKQIFRVFFERMAMENFSFIEAIRAGDRDKCVSLLLENRDYVNERGGYNWNNSTPLLLAAKGGHLGIAELLLEHGAVLHDKDRYGIAL